MTARPIGVSLMGVSLVALACQSVVCGESRADDIFVSPDGDDAHAGTAERPFATLERARDAAREARKPVTITVRGGTYYLPRTLVLTEADSNVTWQSARDGPAVISGGSRPALAWSPGPDGIFRTRTPAGLRIDRLFVNGDLQRMARYPNCDASILPYGGYAADAFARERAAGWADPTGGYIHAMHRAHWGGYHYRITGKNAEGDITYEGGWQNNRQMGMHPEHRFVENIREELDAPGEWFHAPDGELSFIPPPGVDPRTAVVETAGLPHLVELQGARNITLRGLVFRHTARTFMEVKEPLLRSDWTIYRGGAVRFEGCEDCTVADCEFDHPGGNAVFAGSYNRRIRIVGCDIRETGAGGVVFVGSPEAVRNPLFEYNQRLDYADLDRTPGPATDDYPADCIVEDCLLRGIGRVEKQAAGIEISMSMGITVRHCSIYDASRAGINVSEGTWGGHRIEFCDVFDTVKETGDHGSFNSWGRDRFWGLRGAPPEELPELALLDAVRPTVIRNNRWRCDRGWDVDLDDGSSNYEITDNLFLNGGLKLREGFHRTVRNNIAVNNTLHPHVWYANSGDEVTGNIWMAAYRPAGGMPDGNWGREIDRNLFASSEADRIRFARHGCDAASLTGDPLFVDPANGDYRVKEESPARALGFRNFPMDRFGVRKAALRKVARTPELPAPADRAQPAAGDTQGRVPHCWQQARVRPLEGEEYSAFGIAAEAGGVLLENVPETSPAAAAGLRRGDVILGLNGRQTRTVRELLRETDAAGESPPTVEFVRGQAGRTVELHGGIVVAGETSGDGSFVALKLLPAARTAPVRSITARPGTRNEPAATLHDGVLAANYGPVFANGETAGTYKVDLGRPVAVREIRLWSYNQNGNRGSQHAVLFGSASEADPGWDVEDAGRFTPIAEIDRDGAGHYLATGVKRADGHAVGTWRWLICRTVPVTPILENTAFQELQILPMPGPGPGAQDDPPDDRERRP